MARKLVGAIAVGGRVYRAGSEKALASAALSAGVDLTDPRYAAAFGEEPGATPRAPMPVKAEPKPKPAEPQTIAFASAAAEALAEEHNLLPPDFAKKKPSSKSGYTKADVAAIVEKL